MKICCTALIVSLFLVLEFSGGAAAQPLHYGDFSTGLFGWTTEGDVTVDNGEAVLGDNAAIYSLLHQGIPLAAGDYTFEFDFRSRLSGTVPQDPPFAFLDTFYATLYFTNDLSGFNLTPGGFGAALPLLSLDHNGAFDSVVTIGASGKGSDWSRMSLDFRNSYAYVVPVFELIDMNYIDNDSSVRLDNIGLEQAVDPAVVPEPSTIILTGCGILALLAVRMREGRK